MPTFITLGIITFPLHRKMLEYMAEAMLKGKKAHTMQKYVFAYGRIDSSAPKSAGSHCPSSTDSAASATPKTTLNRTA